MSGEPEFEKILTMPPSTLFLGLAYTTCFYVSGDFLLDESSLSIKNENFPSCSSSTPWAKVVIPILICTPLLWRLGQCVVRYNHSGDAFPHLCNAGKYATAFSVVIFGVFHDSWLKSSSASDRTHQIFRIVWIAVFVVATLYQFSWDVFMDWGLRFGRGEGRPQRLFPTKVYVLFVPLDLLLRFLWVLSLIPYKPVPSFFQEILSSLDPFLAFCEVCRRLGWCLLRVENEHLSNASKYRTVDFVPMMHDCAEDSPTDVRARKDVDEKTRKKMLCVELSLVAGLVFLISILAYFSP